MHSRVVGLRLEGNPVLTYLSITELTRFLSEIIMQMSRLRLQ